tara:strand:+ start:3380 stop:3886 length:507 start_codon:yes stop_codon:yes gene_type:complete
MKEIQLTQGKVALVDDEDYEYLNQWKWYANKFGNIFYAVKNIKIFKGKIRPVLMHRFLSNNKNTKMHTDHINGDGLDNRKINLRICTHSQNLMNRGASINNKTGYKGVSYDKKQNKFKAQIGVNKKNITLLRTNNPIDAARAYNTAAQKYHGEFAQLNVIPEENLLNL